MASTFHLIYSFIIILPILLPGCEANFGAQNDRTDAECKFPFTDVNDLCLYGFCRNTTSTTYSYLEALTFCLSFGEGSNLVIFNDGNEYTSVLKYLNEIDYGRACSYWAGGTNLNQNGVWQWYDGEPVPMNIPFWGTSGTNVLPSTDASARYALLSSALYWALTNTNGDAKSYTMPLCQYRRKRHNRHSSRHPSHGHHHPSHGHHHSSHGHHHPSHGHHHPSSFYPLYPMPYQ